MMKVASLLLVLALVAVPGCASSGAAADGGTQSSSSNSSVITRAEIQESGLANMEDVIQRLRPQYLRGRGRTSVMQGADNVQVYLDDVHLGTPSVLRNVNASSVQRVEFVRGPDTGFRFGMNHSAGVILIITK